MKGPHQAIKTDLIWALFVLDLAYYATEFPEAMSLRVISSCSVAETLLHVISSCGEFTSGQCQEQNQLYINDTQTSRQVTCFNTQVKVQNSHKLG